MRALSVAARATPRSPSRRAASPSRGTQRRGAADDRGGSDAPLGPSGARGGPTCIAVDWSGALTGERRAIWLAEARRGELVRLECGRDRAETIAELVACARRERELVVGLDFAFSFPAWFLRARGLASARELWDLVARDGERWLACPPHPFWGRPGVRQPAHDPERPAWRVTESEAVRERGIGPKSTFQIGGAGSVGTGSLRGMPYLARLQDAGFSIWPFDAPRTPLAVEIYPRQLTGPVVKSSRVARALHLQAHLPDAPVALQKLAESSEDAFDAAVSAVRMQRSLRSFLRRARAGLGTQDALEGRIFAAGSHAASALFR